MSRQAHSWGLRGAVIVQGRAVHYRRAGPPGTPAVILLHGSPESASAVHEAARLLSQRICVIALDTPGNGLSQPLDQADPDRADYARHLIAFMDVMGVARAGLYGFHTGAGTAMAAALLAPERITALALDGLAVWTPDERADLLAHYCVIFPPAADGSHLARIWARLEEQLIFFPWYHARMDGRMALPITPMETRLRRLRDWLTAHEHYPAPYRAAFKAKGEDGPDRVSAPTLVGAMGRDPLSAHLDRLPALAPGVRVERWGDDRAGALEAIVRHLAAHPGAAASRPDPSDKALLAKLAAPQARHDWAPDDHGGFLLKLWRDMRLEAIETAGDQAALEAALAPHALHARVTAAIQARTGL
ncbi:alpha/beta fold hydrolase [Hyphomonadaceae bacterium BL14]|nr:alpha/beta fold hydrolase [Hyphomonadaceae bacterium BL14]